jgi:transposase
MKKRRKHYTPEEKVAILRKHLVEGVPISDLCEESGLQPTVFYRWQKEFFENGAAAFQQRGRSDHQPEQERIAYLEKKVQTKDEVLAEGHACGASAGDSGRAGSEAGGGAETAADSSPAGRVTDENGLLPVCRPHIHNWRSTMRTVCCGYVPTRNWMTDLAGIATRRPLRSHATF